MKNKRYNEELDKRLNDIFIFTKDNRDKIEYNEILRLLDYDYVNKHVLSYNLKNNYCGTYKNVVHYYTGLKLKTI